MKTEEHAALRLQKQIIHVVKRAAELGPAFRRAWGATAPSGRLWRSSQASGQLPGIPQEVLEEVWGMEVNHWQSTPKNPSRRC